jgi:hypothetical protein
MEPFVVEPMIAGGVNPVPDVLRPARKNLDRHPQYILAAYVAAGAQPPRADSGR